MQRVRVDFLPALVLIDIADTGRVRAAHFGIRDELQKSRLFGNGPQNVEILDIDIRPVQHVRAAIGIAYLAEPARQLAVGRRGLIATRADLPDQSGGQQHGAGRHEGL